MLYYFDMPPNKFMKTLVHAGTMKRVRITKEGREYKQIIIPNPKNTVLKDFTPSYFNAYLPLKFTVADKKVK